MAASSPSICIWSPPSGREYETLKRLEDRLIGGLQPEDLLTLTRKAAEQGLIGSDVKANIESMDSSMPHPLVCRYLFYSVSTKIFDKSGEVLKPAEHEQWLKPAEHEQWLKPAEHEQWLKPAEHEQWLKPAEHEQWLKPAEHEQWLKPAEHEQWLKPAEHEQWLKPAEHEQWLKPAEHEQWLKPAEHEQWLNLLSHSNSAIRFLARHGQPWGRKSTNFGEQDVPLLTEALAGCSSKWREIGISLGLPSNKLDYIAMMHSKPILCLNAVLTSWVVSRVSYTKPPVLKSLEEALGSQMVGLGIEASTLRDSIEKIIAANTRKVCPFYEQLDSATKAEAFGIIHQTPKANSAEGKSVLLEVRVRAPFEANLTSKWYCDGEHLSDGSVVSSFEGVHVFLKCISAHDLTAEGTYICKVFQKKRKGFFRIETYKKSEQILLTLTTPIDVHCEILTNFYTCRPAVPEDTWPPIVGNTYISLALIKQEGIHQAGKYGRCTIRGDMDDIYADKESTDFVKAFNNLSSGMRVLVEGRRGTGKTTLVHKVSQGWGNGCLKMKFVRLVFLVHLRALCTAPNIDLSTILNCFYSSDSAKCDILKYAEKHNGLGLCFILDGLDEYSPNSTCDNFIFSLIKKQILPNALVIVASCPVAVAEFRSIANIQVEVLGFLKEQIRDYIDHYFSAESKRANLYKYLQQHPNVERICYLPIHVAMVCFLFDIEAELPSTETDIYKVFTRFSILRILSRFEDDPSLPSLEDLPSPQRDTYMSICKLAYEMTVSSKQVMQQTEFQALNKKSEGDLLGLVTVDKLAMRCGFQKMYTFLHLTFQEFLAAFYVSHLPKVQQMELLEQYGQAEHMQQVWKFYCGLTKLELGKVFDILFTESSHLNTVHMIQCMFESQSRDLVVRDKSLAFSDFYLDHSDFAAAAYVLSNATVQELSFNGCVFGREEVATLVEKAGSSLSQILSLTFCGDTAEQVEVANILAHFLPSLGLFDLSSTNLSPNVVSALTENLSHPTLQVLKVGSRGNDLYRSLELPLDLACTLKCKSFRNICFSGSNGVCLPTDAQWPLPFCFCCNHPKLVLSCHPLCAMEVKALSHDLKANFYSHLCLINCDIGDEAIFYLAQGLSCCLGLETLELCCNRVGDTGAIYLANSIKSCLKLGKLNLSCNRIGNEGALAVANSVSSNVKVYLCQNCITKLDEISGMGSIDFNTIDLSSRGLLDFDISSLTATLLLLKNLDKLRQFYLQANSISCNGMTPLSSVLKRCSNLLVLNLSSNNIGGEGAQILADALAHCTNLLKLDVSSNNLGSNGAKAIARVLTGCTKMLELNISFNSIGCDGTEAIAQALHHCPVLQELDMSSNDLRVKGAKFLADALRYCRSVWSLHANSNDIGDEGAIVLAEGLRCCRSLQVLKINSNNIGFEGACAITDSLEHCPFIYMLDIGFNNIELELIESRCNVCFPRSFQNLAMLNIANIQLNSLGAQSLARGMSGSLNIREFHVRENSIGDDGAKAITGILSKCDSLEVLDVAQNGITAIGAIALASALKGKKVHELDFGKNGIGSKGALALSAILNSATLRRLKLDSCVIGPEGAVCLAQSLKHCSNLLELNIGGNSIESSGAIAIAECLSQCRNVQILNLSDTVDGCRALAKKLTECNNLHVLDISQTAFLVESSLMNFFENCVDLQKLNADTICSMRPPDIGFIHGLKFCINLEKIDVSSTSLSQEMVAEFFFLLRNCRLLKELFVAENYVGLDSAKILSESLFHCKNLEVLDVAATFINNLENRGELTRCLCSKFMHNVKLRSLNIEANYIGTAGVIALVDSLKHCNKLQELSIGSNKFMDEGAIVLAGALKYWPGLCILRVGCKGKYAAAAFRASNSIGIDGFKSLGDALKHCPNLRELDVSDNKIKNESICHLDRCLHVNSKEVRRYKDVFGFKMVPEHRAQVDLVDTAMKSPLLVASEKGNGEVVELLLEHGAQVDLVESFQRSPLLLASEEGNGEVVKFLLEHGAQVDSTNEDGRSALCIACENGTVEDVKLLLEHGAQVDLEDLVKRSPLLLASEEGNGEVVKLLLEHGAQVDLVDEDGQSPLLIASQNRNLEAVKVLLKHGAEVDLRDGYEMVTSWLWSLHSATETRDLEAVNLLLEHGAKVDLGDEFVTSPLHIASRKGSVGAMKMLLKHGALVDLRDVNGRSPLHIVCENGNVEAVKFLLKHGAQVNLRDVNGRSPLHSASEKGVVKLLLEYGAEVDLVDKDSQSPLHSASEKAYALEAVKLLLAHGAQVNLLDRSGISPLHKVGENGCDETLKVLVNHGAQVNYRNKIGRSPLYLASLIGNTEAAEFLLEHGAEVDLVDEDGRSPLHIASETGDGKFVKLLLEHGAQVNLVDGGGRSPLHSASETANVEAMKLLLEHGILGVDLRNNDGLTSLMLACQNGHREAVLLLLDADADIHITNNKGQTALDVVLCSGHADIVEQFIKLRTKSSFPGIFFSEGAKKEIITTSANSIKLENVGISLSIPEGALHSTDLPLEVQIQPCFSGSWEVPENLDLVSPAYIVKLSSLVTFKKDVLVKIWHHANLETEEDCEDMVFLSASTTPEYRDGRPVYVFQEITGVKGSFRPREEQPAGVIALKHFSLLGIFRRIRGKEGVCDYEYGSDLLISFVAPSEL